MVGEGKSAPFWGWERTTTRAPGRQALRLARAGLGGPLVVPVLIVAIAQVQAYRDVARCAFNAANLALAEEAEPKLLGSEQVRWLRRLEVEYDNLRAVMAWSRDGSIDGEIGLRIAGALTWFWVLSGVAWEGREWVEVMLARRSPDRSAIVQGSPSLWVSWVP